MSAYKPSKKQFPSWMMMNDTSSKHWMKSSDVDLEIVGNDNGLTQAQIDDGISQREKDLLHSVCRYREGWNLEDAPDQTDTRTCDTVAVRYPEVNLRHGACYRSIEYAAMGKITESKFLDGCNMYSPVNGNVYPEYAKCLQPGGMDDPDCQRTCYTWPNQKGCELLTAGLTQDDFKKRLRALDRGPDPNQPPPPPPPLEETVVVAASMRSVTPSAIRFAFMDPQTKRAVVVEKTLSDMFKPTDKVSVVLNKKTNKFVGLSKKNTSIVGSTPTPKPPAPTPTPTPAPAATRVVTGTVVKVISPNQVQIKYVKPDKTTVIVTVTKAAHGMKLNGIINVTLKSAAPYAFVSIAKK